MKNKYDKNDYHCWLEKWLDTWEEMVRNGEYKPHERLVTIEDAEKEYNENKLNNNKLKHN